MKKFILLSAIVLSCAATVKAQSYSYTNDMRHIFSVNYQMNIPSGSSRDFISNASFEGVNINWTYFILPKVSIGLDYSYNNYYKKIGQQIYRPNDNVAVNAAQYRYTQAFPLKAQAKYFFSQDRYIKGYAGLGIGAMSAGQHIVVQDIDQWHNSWGFLLSPEVGVLIPFRGDLPCGVNVNAGYNWSTNKSTLGKIDVDKMHSFYFNVGLYVAIY